MALEGENPPAIVSYTNTIELTSISDSKITDVSVYSSRAEVTRVFKVQLKTGQNRVNINGLPNVILDDTVRLEGRGPATIHDVSVSYIPLLSFSKSTTSPALEALLSRKGRIAKALERSKIMHDAIGKYLTTLRIEHVAIDDLDKTVQKYDATCEKLDDRILDLEKQFKDIDEEIRKEQDADTPNKGDASTLLRKKVSLSLFAEKENEVELTLIYAVTNANWTALYDIRVDTQKKGAPIALIYKAVVSQNTDEDWEDVHLTLETATPTYQVGLPTLYPWTLSFHYPFAQRGVVRTREVSTGPGLFGGSLPEGRSSETFCARSTEPLPEMYAQTTTVTSKGNVSATFGVPGIITVSSGATAHSVTITELKLDATMSWVVIPKIDAKTHLSAKIKNNSEYTLLGGTAGVYVDGSFISKSVIPTVSPGESFDCALGLDPAIRISYHPLSKKSAKTGFYTKTNVTFYTQRISVHNSKSIPVTNLRIVDQIPTSSQDKIVVKLISPALPIVQGDFDTSGKARNSAKSAVVLSQGVRAQWGDGTEDEVTAESGTAPVVRDGKLSWICEAPTQGKINLVLQWEVSAPAGETVVNI